MSLHVISQPVLGTSCLIGLSPEMSFKLRKRTEKHVRSRKVKDRTRMNVLSCNLECVI